MCTNKYFPGRGDPRALAERIKVHWKEHNPRLYRSAKRITWSQLIHSVR